MDPQRRTPIEIRRYGYATPPAFALGGGGGADTGVGSGIGDEDWGCSGAFVPTRGREAAFGRRLSLYGRGLGGPELAY